MVYLREALGLTQTELADISGVSQPNISAYESGRRKPRPETLERLLKALRPRPSVVLAAHRAEVIELARQRGMDNVRVFGSAVRGEDTPDSDIDLLVDAGPDASIFDLAGLALDLEETLGFRVDIVQSGGTGRVMESIEHEAVPL
ncbi:DNA-binding protein [Arthrobacter crystallopoietes BAB-32]|uniref:DNA-binding protein n=1 Tax=Arthrobacter crystallopoietes BAB-32 TaxID=1246476 RepID=N1V242_9MICC|nr:DNA-binding protein [Arthrobacter crystallopoietes BAB-32]